MHHMAANNALGWCSFVPGSRLRCNNQTIQLGKDVVPVVGNLNYDEEKLENRHTFAYACQVQLGLKVSSRLIEAQGFDLVTLEPCCENVAT